MTSQMMRRAESASTTIRYADGGEMVINLSYPESVVFDVERDDPYGRYLDVQGFGSSPRVMAARHRGKLVIEGWLERSWITAPDGATKVGEPTKARRQRPTTQPAPAPDPAPAPPADLEWVGTPPPMLTFSQ